MNIEISREPDVPRLSDEEIKLITKLVFVEPKAQEADLIFIFGFGLGHTEANWKLVAKLFEEGCSSLILVNGLLDPHAPTDYPIAHNIRDTLIKFGIPKKTILTQDKSRNTLEDVILGKKLLETKNIFPKSILYVSKAHHSGRCYLTLKKYFSHVKLYTYSFNAVYNNIEVAKEDWWLDPVARARVYGEYLRINKYSERGDIALPVIP